MQQRVCTVAGHSWDIGADGGDSPAWQHIMDWWGRIKFLGGPQAREYYEREVVLDILWGICLHCYRVCSQAMELCTAGQGAEVLRR